MNIENELNGLKYFVSKKIEQEAFGKKIGLFSKLKILNSLKKENPKSKWFINGVFAVLGITVLIPLINLFIALFTHASLMFIGKEILVLCGAFLISYISLNLVGNNYKEDIKNIVVKKNLPNIILNEGDMLEIGMYLTDEEKENITTKIYKQDAVNLLNINEIIELKEKMAVESKKKKMAEYLHQM